MRDPSGQGDAGDEALTLKTSPAIFNATGGTQEPPEEMKGFTMWLDLPGVNAQ